MCNTLPKTARHIRLGSSILLLLALVLATLSLPTRTHAQDDEQCFLETGYCIAGRIQEFWQHNGGLAVFGYPISPQQPAVREGKTYQVQWFQRHRLELHPDNAPPYDVLIGHLGKDVLAAQSRPWATTFPATDQLPNCRYFAETGHNICGDMLQAWQTHGLDLDGQPTISEQESLALFGMPISEAHTETLDDGQDYTVQWFERARFELHPENNPPYHVLFGLLGEMMYTPDTTHTTALPPAFMREQTRFAFTFFTTLRQAQGNMNMFISPTSLAYALAMTYNGADGATQQAMAQALHVQGMGIPAVNEAFAALMQATQQADPDVTLTIANALWAREGLSFAPDFLQRNQQYYHAEVDVLDFDDPGAVATINGWVSKQTHGKIPSIVDELKPETIMVLINAIYFKGGWTEPFDEDETTDLPFTLLDGTTKEVPMMTQFDSYRYYAGEDFQAVSLPYGKERIMMTIFLPSEETTLPAWLQQLDATTWRQWLDNMSEEDGSVRLPRFKLEDDHSLEDTLTHMGMGLAFDCTQADFSRMYAMPNVCISSVRQKTFVEVNEEGTEAAAATSVEMELTSAMPMPAEPFTMIVDRPFFFAIHDDETGAILFMGMIVEP
jgi:serpin B